MPLSPAAIDCLESIALWIVLWGFGSLALALGLCSAASAADRQSSRHYTELRMRSKRGLE